MHTDPAGERDAVEPPNVRIYLIASASHITGPMPPTSRTLGTFVGQAALNPLDTRPVVRSLFQAMDRWVTANVAPPPSRHPRIANGTLVPRERAGWPAIPGVHFPPPQLIAYRLDFGPNWSGGLVENEPPRIGAPFVVRVPAVDADGNDRAGIRLPEVAVPLATLWGWNYRDAGTGAPEHLASEVGSYLPFPRTRVERQRTGDPRRSIEERYPSKGSYLARITAVANQLAAERYVLARDVPVLVTRASEHWDWATKSDPR